jgi:hypothetical protein
MARSAVAWQRGPRGPGNATRSQLAPLVRTRERSYVIRHLTRNVSEETLRDIGVAFIGMAVAIGMVGLGVTEPAVAKVRKGCRDQQQHQVNQTGECNDIIIENLDRSSTGHFYRTNSQKAKKPPRRTAAPK